MKDPCGSKYLQHGGYSLPFRGRNFNSGTRIQNSALWAVLSSRIEEQWGKFRWPKCSLDNDEWFCHRELSGRRTDCQDMLVKYQPVESDIIGSVLGFFRNSASTSPKRHTLEASLRASHWFTLAPRFLRLQLSGGIKIHDFSHHFHIFVFSSLLRSPWRQLLRTH